MAGDPYFDSVQLLLHGEGSNGGTTFTDSSRFARSVSRLGAATTSSTQFKYGSTSIYLSNVADYDTVYATGLSSLGTGDFTIEGWFYLIAGGAGATSNRRVWYLGTSQYVPKLWLAANGNPAKLELNYQLDISPFTLTQIIAAPVATITDSTWVHVAVTRSGNNWTIWVDGASYATGTSSLSMSQTDFSLGKLYDGIHMYADDVRVTRGVARYTGAFTPSASAFPDSWEISETISNGVGLDEYFAELYQETLTQTVGVGSTPIPGSNETLADIITAVALATPSWAFSRTISNTVGIAPAQKLDFGAALSQAIGLDDALSPTTKYAGTISDLLRIAEALNAGRPITLTSTVGVAQAIQLVRGAHVLEALGLAEAVVSPTKFARTASDTIGVSDSLLRFIYGLLTDTVGMASSISPSRLVYDTTSTGIGVNETALTPRLILRVLMEEDADVTTAQAVQMTFTGALQDAIQISAGYVAPDGTFTTWAVNTRTGAVTEYENFVFNSFAQRGHKYLGASSSGLYELLGDTDHGQDIVARIKSGLMQLGGSRFTSLQTAYLGMRADGSVLLKVETGDGASYTYNVVVQNTQTTRVRVGKGIRARYISFELTTTGQDFDLDSVEFVPIVAGRRV